MDNLLLKDIIQWDVLSWKKAIDFWEENISWDKVTNVLEIGARDGGLSLWLVLKNKNVICSDISNSEKAIQLHKKYHVDYLVSYQDIDATNIPYENYFDVVIVKSVLGGIGSYGNNNSQQKAIQEIHKSLKKGGKFLFAENLKASLIHQLARKKFVKWGNSWKYLTIEETHSLLSKFSDYKINTTGFIAAFGRSESQRNILARIDNFILNKITPNYWHYIVYGIATK